LLQNDLIFDIGMHDGNDTRYYLDKGFRVVAIEANPVLADKAEKRFATEIKAGKLTIENIGIHIKPETLTFYINESNSEWSSFVETLGKRDGKFSTISVECVTLEALTAKHGVPHFLKIDVEGVDHLVVKDIPKLASRPRFVSVEDNGIYSLLAMYEAGIREFKFTNQPEQQRSTNPMTGQIFGGASSGVFGDDIEGQWLSLHEAFDYYVRNVRPPNQAPINGWWDIHGVFR
jgi:FkbM family methyltransferase